MLGSENLFFYQSKPVLKKRRLDVICLLTIKGYSEKQIALYLEAYDYFCKNPSGYDGATAVSDLCDIPGLDLDAMLHDYHYLVFNAAADGKYKEMADDIFKEGIAKKGKSGYSSWSRKAGLWIASPYLIIRARLKYGRITALQMLQMTQHYQIFMNNE